MPVTKGTYYFDPEHLTLASTEPDGRGRPKVIADFRIGPNTVDDGRFVEQACRHLRAVLDLCDELADAMEGGDDA